MSLNALSHQSRRAQLRFEIDLRLSGGYDCESCDHLHHVGMSLYSRIAETANDVEALSPVSARVISDVEGPLLIRVTSCRQENAEIFYNQLFEAFGRALGEIIGFGALADTHVQSLCDSTVKICLQLDSVSIASREFTVVTDLAVA